MALVWLGGHWHFLALAGAAVLVACCYFPAYCLSGLDSDMVIPAVFYQDVMNGGNAADWAWGGASFLFPDLTAYFFVHAILGDGVGALEAASALLFAGWLIVAILGYRSCELPHVEVFAALMLLVLLAIAGLSLPSFFHLVEHSGTYLVTVLVAGALLRIWVHGEASWWRLAAWGAIIFLAAASDGLTMVVLVGPAMASLLAGALRYRDRRARGIGLAVAVGVAGVAGMRLAGVIFSPHLTTGGYLRIDAESVLNSLRSLRQILDLRFSGIIAVLTYADAVVIAGTGIYLARQLVFSASSAESPIRFFLLAYTFFLLASNWACAILSGNLWGVYSKRYYVLALVWPVVLLAGCASAKLPWRRWAAQLMAVGVTGACVAFALHAPVPVRYLYQTQMLNPGLAGLMKREHCPIALGDYWSANLADVTSNGAVRVYPLSIHEQAYFWFCNRTCFAKPPEGGYRLVLPKYQDPEMVRANFGEPARVEKLGEDEVWVYAPQDALRFIPTFDTVGNHQTFPDDNTYRVQGLGIYHWIGKIENDRAVARGGRDLNGYVAEGPGFVLGPGRYRAAYTYEFLAAPEGGREPIFTSSLKVSGNFETLGSEVLTYSGPGRQEAVEEFTIARGKSGSLVCRIEFRGSGAIAVDQQEVQRLGD